MSQLTLYLFLHFESHINSVSNYLLLLLDDIYIIIIFFSLYPSPTKMLRVRGHQAKRMLVMVLPNWGFGVSGNRQDILKLEMLYEQRVIQSSFINIVYFWISVKI